MSEDRYNPSEIEQLFRTNPNKLLSVYESLDDPLAYPYIAYYTAIQLATLGETQHAREVYNVALQAYEGDTFGTNRVRLGIAHLSRREGDDDYCQQLAEEVLKSSEDDVHKMAACRFIAEVYLASGKIDDANRVFQDALMYAGRAYTKLNVSPERLKLLTQDQLLINQNLADLSSAQGQMENAMRYQREVVRLTELIQAQMPQYTVYAHIKQAELFERQGKLDDAMVSAVAAQSEATTHQRNDLHVMAQMLEMRLLGKMGQDKRAEEILRTLENQPLVHTDTLQMLLEKTRQWLYINGLDRAERLIQEIKSIRTNDISVQHRLKVLETALGCMRGDLRGKLYQAQLESAIQFYEDCHFKLESSEAKLILAWALAIERRTKFAKDWLSECTKDCLELQHVSHIWRWYLLSHKKLSHLWWLVDTNISEMVEEFAEKAPSLHVQQARFYAFGHPRLLFDGDNQLKQIREGTKHAPLMVLFAEEKSLVLGEIMETIWYDSENPRASFHQLRHKNPFIHELIHHDAQTLIYHLNEEAFSYVDLWHFRDLVEQAYSENDPATRLMYYRVALSLSDEPIAKGIDHPYLTQKRDEYGLLRARCIKTALGLRESLRDQVMKMPIPFEWGLELKQAGVRFGEVSGFD